MSSMADLLLHFVSSIITIMAIIIIFWWIFRVNAENFLVGDHPFEDSVDSIALPETQTQAVRMAALV